MKNLKKVLALVLAVSVLMGLATMASAKVAADYTDAASVKEDRTEAVDVLSSLGVFQGSSGSFNPDAILTRAEAAKIICYMTMDKEDADKLIAGVAPYLDVPATHWAAGPIAHCKTQGIIAGVGNGNFDPMGQLTGLQFAKMLLTALGYDAQREGLVGSEWGNRTAAIAISDAGITGGVSSAALAAPLSRQDACQLAFNTLEATMVKYADKGGTISSGGITINLPGATADPLKKGTSTQWGDYDGSEVQFTVPEEATVQFCEYYFGDLKKYSETNDLGLETHEWHYKGDKIGAYDEDLDKTVVVTDDRKSDNAAEKTVGDILTDKSYMNYSSSKLKTTAKDPSYDLYVNGVEIKTNKATVPLHRGDVVYAQTNSNKVVTTVAVARYQLAKVDEVTTSLTTAEKEKGAEYRIRLTDLDGTTILNNRYFDDHDDNGATLADFDAATYTEGTVLAVAVNDTGDTGSAWKIVDSYVANVVSGKPSGVKNEKDGYIRVNGQSYNFADTMSYAADLNTNIDAATTLKTRKGAFDTGMKLGDKYDFDTEYKVYLTKENYVLGVEGATKANLEDVRYVTGIHAVESSFGGVNWYAQTITMDGKIEDVQIEKGTVMAIETRLLNADDITSRYTAAETATDALKKLQKEPEGFYIVNDNYYSENDEAFLNINQKQDSNNSAMSMIWIGDGKDPTAPTDGKAEAKEYDPFGAATSTITGSDLKYGDSRFKTADAGTFYIGSETKYITVDSGTNTDGTGDGSLSVKTGTGSASAKNGTTVCALYDVDEKSEPLVVVFVKNDTLEGNLGSSNLVYLTGDGGEKVSSSNYKMTAYFMKDDDGQSKMTETEIVCDKTERGFYTYTYSTTDGERVYELSEIDSLSTGAVTPSEQNDIDDGGVYDKDEVGTVCDDEDGGTLNATIFDVDSRDRVTGVGIMNGGKTYPVATDPTKLFMIDAQKAANAEVIWVGDDDVKDTDNNWFKGYFDVEDDSTVDTYFNPDYHITSTADMRECLAPDGEDAKTNKILADIYMEGNDILFIAVLGFSALQ